MLSTAAELIGFALLTAGAAVIGGLAPALLTAAGCFLFVGWALDTDRPKLPKRVKLQGPTTNGAIARERAGKG